MAIQRLRCAWTGSGVEGPGLSTFFAEADGTVAIQVAAAALFDAVKAFIPAGTSIAIPNGGDVINEADGELQSTWGGSSTTTITGTASGSFAGGVGARIVWNTSTIRAGRRVRGSTFIVPLGVNAYESNGTLAAGTITAMTTGITNFFVQVPDEFRIWSRPRAGLAGVAVPCTTGTAPDKVSWLRSRRT